jgi:hypothetical protein
MVIYAPALCPKCGAVFRSDVAIAEPPWIIPTYRAIGGVCGRCGTRGRIPDWVYRFHAIASDCRREASDSQRRAQVLALTLHLRRHRTAKRTTEFLRGLSGPWRSLGPQFRGMSNVQRRAQLTFLLWILDEN